MGRNARRNKPAHYLLHRRAPILSFAGAVSFDSTIEAAERLINTPLQHVLSDVDMIGQSHPSPRPSPREGRGRTHLLSRRYWARSSPAVAAGPLRPAACENQASPYAERTRNAFPLSPQRGEGRGEGCDKPATPVRAKCFAALHARASFR